MIKPFRTAATTIDFWGDVKFSRSRGGKSADVTRFPSGPMKKGSILWGSSDKVCPPLRYRNRRLKLAGAGTHCTSYPKYG